MGPPLRYMPLMFLSRVGSALPPSSTVKSMQNHVYMCVMLYGFRDAPGRLTCAHAQVSLGRRAQTKLVV